MYGIYANIWGIWMVNVTIYGIHTDPMGIWLVVWLPCLAFSHSVGFLIIPIDELIFSRGVAQPPTRYFLYGGFQLVMGVPRKMGGFC